MELPKKSTLFIPFSSKNGGNPAKKQRKKGGNLGLVKLTPTNACGFFETGGFSHQLHSWLTFTSPGSKDNSPEVPKTRDAVPKTREERGEVSHTSMLGLPFCNYTGGGDSILELSKLFIQFIICHI